MGDPGVFRDAMLELLGPGTEGQAPGAQDLGDGLDIGLIDIGRRHRDGSLARSGFHGPIGYLGDMDPLDRRPPRRVQARQRQPRSTSVLRACEKNRRKRREVASAAVASQGARASAAPIPRCTGSVRRGLPRVTPPARAMSRMGRPPRGGERGIRDCQGTTAEPPRSRHLRQHLAPIARPRSRHRHRPGRRSARATGEILRRPAPPVQRQPRLSRRARTDTKRFEKAHWIPYRCRRGGRSLGRHHHSAPDRLGSAFHLGPSLALAT